MLNAFACLPLFLTFCSLRDAGLDAIVRRSVRAFGQFFDEAAPPAALPITIYQCKTLIDVGSTKYEGVTKY